MHRKIVFVNFMIFSSRFKLLWISTLVICLNSTTADAKTFHWVDAQGKTHFSDKIPPEEAKYQRDVLNKTGRVVETLDRAKTKEEYDQEQRMQVLREEQEDLIAKQNAEDRVLLSTYRSVEDMKLTLNGRMQALDAQRRVAEGNLKRLQKQLESQQKQAAESERNGQTVSKKLLADINSTEDQIKLASQEISNHVTKKNEIKAEFEQNIERFKSLAKANASEDHAYDRDIKIEELEGLFNCSDSAQCNKAWTKSKEFVKRYSTTPINNETEQLILSSDPARENDLSLSVSRMQAGNDRQKLFLDIRCHHSRVGAELCASPKTEEIRSAFKPFIQSGLN
jgi:hypothetical protein